ncbi:MAG: hypothetical protein H6558_12090 [Lewinellaceae bacterium]|nr:hypothetical protein [Lewinellaceae bacterium]
MGADECFGIADDLFYDVLLLNFTVGATKEAAPNGNADMLELDFRRAFPSTGGYANQVVPSCSREVMVFPGAGHLLIGVRRCAAVIL